MVNFTGKYQSDRFENIVEHLVAIGVSEEHAKKGTSQKPILEIKHDGDKFTFQHSVGDHVISNTFTLGVEITEKLPMGIEAKSVAKLEGDALVIYSTTKDGNNGTRTYKFADNGELVSIMASDKPNVPEGKRYYKRI